MSSRGHMGSPLHPDYSEMGRTIGVIISLPISVYIKAVNLADGGCRYTTGALELPIMNDPDGPKRRSAPSRRLSLAGIILVGITLVAAGLTIWDRHEEAIASYRREISNLGTALAEQTERSMQAVDLVLKEVQAEVVARGIQTPEQLRRS